MGRLGERVQVVVTGVPQLDRSLAELGAKVQRRVARRAARQGAKVVKRVARSKAPVDKGLLRSALVVRAGKSRPGAVVVKVEVGKRDQLVAASGDDFYYPASTEYGRKAPTKGKRAGRGERVPGLHWLRRAKDEAESQATAAMWADFKVGLASAIAEARK